MSAQKRANKKQGFFTHLWNEFLFAREFEYETPLTPDEVAQTLKTLEGESHTYFSRWHWSTLQHQLTYTPTGDKAGDFSIHLAPRKEHWWQDDTRLQETEGTLSVDNVSGMTIVKGRTRFGGQFYMLMLFLIATNILTTTTAGNPIWMLIWTGVILLVWYSLYVERNKLSDRIDTLIMEAKVQDSTQRIADEQDSNSQDHLAEMDENVYETTRATYKAP